MHAEMIEFTRRSLAAGLPRSEIATALQTAGWRPAEVRAALESFAEMPFPVPVPRPRPHLSAREAFLYLTMFGALYTTAGNLGAIAFDFIDHFIPDPITRSRSLGAAIRWNLSALIVAFPLFLWTFRIINGAIERDPSQRASRPRKWLTYLTLFVAAMILTGDMIALVYNLLGGEYGLRFLLKAATVAIIAGGIFAYFLGDMRRDLMRRSALFAGAAGAIVTAAILAGLLANGPPGEVRAERLDGQRRQQLQSVARAVEETHRRDGRMPDSLAELRQRSQWSALRLTDPDTDAPYEYAQTGPLSYRLCATFAKALAEETAVRERVPDPWRHAAGHHCFELSVPKPKGE
jgi:hypothetical protein